MTIAPGVGAEFAGYRIESILGRGGVGLVYLAQDLSLPRRVALKILRAEYAQDPQFRERFVRESLVAASLDHINIVPIYKAGEAEGVLYIAMRYVDGTDLRKLLAAEARIGVDRALAILGQIGAALDAAHAHGLCHRDVKPANILVTTGGGDGGTDQAYLVDFGITKRTSTAGLTQVGHFVGTIDYAAPEQIRGMAIDARTDVYSLGCVLYECLAGVPPFRMASDIDTMQAHITAPRPSLVAVRPEMGSAMDHVVRTAMAVKPEDRYGSALAFITAMRAARPWSGVDRRAATRPPGAGPAVVVETASPPPPPAPRSRQTRVAQPPAEPATKLAPQPATVAAPVAAAPPPAAATPAVPATPGVPAKVNLMPVALGVIALLAVGGVGVVLLAHRGGDTGAVVSTSPPTPKPTAAPTPTLRPGEVRLSTALLTIDDFTAGTVKIVPSNFPMYKIGCGANPDGETDEQRVAFSGQGSTVDRQYYNAAALFPDAGAAQRYLHQVDVNASQLCPARLQDPRTAPQLGDGTVRLVFPGTNNGKQFTFDALYVLSGRVVAVVMVSREGTAPPDASEAVGFAQRELEHIKASSG